MRRPADVDEDDLGDARGVLVQQLRQEHRKVAEARAEVEDDQWRPALGQRGDGGPCPLQHRRGLRELLGEAPAAPDPIPERSVSPEARAPAGRDGRALLEDRGVRLPGRAALQVLAQPAAPLVVGGNDAPAADGLPILDGVSLLLIAAAAGVVRHPRERGRPPPTRRPEVCEANERGETFHRSSCDETFVHSTPCSYPPAVAGAASAYPLCKLANLRPTADHDALFGAHQHLAFVVMEDEAAPDTDQTPAQMAAVKIQRMHRQNSFTSEDTDEKARRQWVNFHLENGQYEEALALGWDGDLEKTAQEPTPDSDAEFAEGAASDVADGTSGWSEEQAAASSKIAAVRRGSAARKERNDQQKGAVAIQSRFRNRHSRVKSEGSDENGDGVGEEAEEGPFGDDTHPELSGSGSDFGDDDDRGDDGDGGDGGEDGDGGNGGLGRETDAVAGDTAGGEGGVVHLSNGQRRRAAASTIAAHRKGAKRRQNLVQEAEEASVRASRLNALVGAKARQSSSEAVGAIETQSLPEPTSPSAPTTVREAMASMTLDKKSSPKRFSRPPGAPPSMKPPSPRASAVHAPPSAPHPIDSEAAAVSDESLRQYWSSIQRTNGGTSADELTSAELSLLRSEITRLKMQNKQLLQRSDKRSAKAPPLTLARTRTRTRT